ncbi:hypothetical protein RN001_014757 [Aquatica leii]|uniref:Pacifastin domain-containing protein n=1 Tax=Aquatica leii TaxID=1421715 RepID=A0AAN7SKQ9_9COLE|nr:hypothetical protein RN001_014757 [Aquatica leii]
MMKLHILILFLGVIAASLAFVCQDDVLYKENDCNGCFCTNGLLACTEMGCNHQKHTTMRSCQIGTKSMDACNECWCVDRVGTICTNNKC